MKLVPARPDLAFLDSSVEVRLRLNVDCDQQPGGEGEYVPAPEKDFESVDWSLSPLDSERGDLAKRSRWLPYDEQP